MAELGLLRTTDYRTMNAMAAEFSMVVPESDLDVLSFEDGATRVGQVRRGQPYLIFAITRFKVSPSDRDWTFFKVVKYLKNEYYYWDGLVHMDLAQFESLKQSFFLNRQYHKGNATMAIVEDNRRPISTVYLLDNAKGAIDILPGDEILRSLPRELDGRALPYVGLYSPL